MTSSREQIENIAENGVSFVHHAKPFEYFTQEAADGMVGQITTMNAREFGIDEEWKMKIVETERYNGGRSIRITLVPAE